MPLIAANNIGKSYTIIGGKLQVLKDINLTINEGEFVVIIGPSGAGKSTALHILGGLDAPSSGQVLLDGQDFYKLKENEQARLRSVKTGFVFQFYHLLSEFSALENVVLPALVKENKADIKKFESRGLELLERVGLKERIKHKPKELSGGEQQRVAIARALMNEPKIIFCDEPTGNLDSKTGKDIMELLMSLNQKNKQTSVIVTHDETVAHKAHRVLHMLDGKIMN